MSWRAFGFHYGISLSAGRFLWLKARFSATDLRFLGGGVMSLSDDSLPPSSSELKKIVGRRAKWSISIPLAMRTSLAELPPLGEEELLTGAEWEARRVFRSSGDDTIHDFELLDEPAIVSDEPAVHRRALLVALPRLRLEQWLKWILRFPSPCSRLEPTLPACLRALREAARRDPQYSVPCVYVYGTSSGSGLAILDGERVYATRSLAPGSRSHELENRWRGEEGIRLLRETILSCEDRNPHLELAALVGIGDIDPDWLGEAALATQLQKIPPPSPPPGMPEELHPHGNWCFPYGTLLGGRPCRT